MENLLHCPVCDHDEFEPSLVATDYLISGKSFTIVKCGSCGFQFTNPRPDKSEMGDFYISDQYLPHQTGIRNLKSILYKWARKRALRKKYRWISQYKSPGILLDYGAGTGEFLDYFKNKSWHVEGIEMSKKAREFAKTRYSLELKSPEECRMPLRPEFDVVTLWHVLEHLHDLSEVLIGLHHSLKDDGIMVIAVPNSDSVDAKMYGNRWAAYDVPRHLYHFNRDTLVKLMERYSFVLREIRPLTFDAYYVSILSEGCGTGLFRFPLAFVRGFISNLMAFWGKGNYSSLAYFFEKKKKYESVP